MTDFPEAGLDAGREALRRFLVGEDDISAMHTKVVMIATETIPGCDLASITLLKDGRPFTPAYTGKTALALDQAQYKAGEGPCLAAVSHRGLEHATTASDERWPAFVAAAAEKGVLATLSIPLGNHESVLGALNLYSETVEHYDRAAQDLACVSLISWALPSRPSRATSSPTSSPSNSNRPWSPVPPSNRPRAS